MSKVTQARNKPGCMLMSLEQMSGDLSAGRLLPEGGTPAAAAITAWPNY